MTFVEARQESYAFLESRIAMLCQSAASQDVYAGNSRSKDLNDSAKIKQELNTLKQKVESVQAKPMQSSYRNKQKEQKAQTANKLSCDYGTVIILRDYRQSDSCNKLVYKAIF